MAHDRSSSQPHGRAGRLIQLWLGEACYAYCIASACQDQRWQSETLCCANHACKRCARWPNCELSSQVQKDTQLSKHDQNSRQVCAQPPALPSQRGAPASPADLVLHRSFFQPQQPPVLADLLICIRGLAPVTGLPNILPQACCSHAEFAAGP